jgi:hypothetical protein
MYPESDYYISISCHLNEKYNTNIPVIPYIVELPDSNNNLRNELNITNDAIVFGRHGGFYQFDLSISHEAIISFLNNTTNVNVYFLFMNTNKFYEHPRIIYLEKNIDLLYKTKFINFVNESLSYLDRHHFHNFMRFDHHLHQLQVS